MGVGVVELLDEGEFVDVEVVEVDGVGRELSRTTSICEGLPIRKSTATRSDARPTVGVVGVFGKLSGIVGGCAVRITDKKIGNKLYQ